MYICTIYIKLNELRIIYKRVDLFEEFEKRCITDYSAPYGRLKNGEHITIEKNSKELDWEEKAKRKKP